MDYLRNSVITVKSGYNEWEKRQPESKGFKSKHSFEKRKGESERIISQYPTRIPLIVERYNKSLPQIDRKKYLVPEDLSMTNLLYVIRKRLKITSEKSIFLFINEKIVPMSRQVDYVYNKYQDEDGFLYIKYCAENTFG